MSLTKVKAGNIILTTPAASSNDVTPATTQYVTTALANLADSAPATLNTLNELAAALGDDANFSTTVTNSIAAKLPLAGGTLTGALIGTSFSDGYISWGAAQLNRYGSNIELQYTPTANSTVYIGANGSNPTRFNAHTGAASFSGNVLIGTESPSAGIPLTVYYNSTSQFHVGGAQAGISNNTYYNGSAWANRNSGAGGSVLQLGTDGSLAFRTATAAASPTLTYKMYMNPDGKLGIGTTNTYNSEADNLIIFDSGNAGLTIATSSTSSNNTIHFADGTSGDAQYRGVIEYAHNDDSMRFKVSGEQEAMRIVSTEDVVIGYNATNTAVSSKTSGTGTLSINQPGRDNTGGHIFMTQGAAQNTWMTICTAHDVGATGMTFLMNATRTGDQNRHCTRLVRYAYNQSFTEITVSQQNTAVEYRVNGTNLQYRFTTGGPYSVTLTIMADG